MRVINLGSCRQDSLDKYFETFHVNKKISYAHYSKEVLEVIKFCKFGNISPDETLYMFRSAMLNKEPIIYRDLLTQNFNMGDIFVIEIASNKTYEYNNRYLHHIAIDTAENEDVRNNIINRIQTKEEIEEDIIEIKNILKKPLVIISHIVTFQEGSRFELSEWLKDICNRNNIVFINPVEELENRNIDLQNTFIQEDKLAHYSEYGHNEIGKIYHDIISNININ